MSQGFVPEGDKLHQLQPQRPGAFIAITEQGRIFEVVALMNEQTVVTREWEQGKWDEEKVEAENQRVQREMQRMQMQSHGGPQAGQRPAPQIIKPGQVARPGTI
jgi:hypothetical protein